MTKAEQVAFNQGVEACRQMAMVAAVSIEVRDDRAELRQRAAAAALLGFAEGAKVLMIGAGPGDTANPAATAFEAIAADPAASGVIECPTCAGRLGWVRDSLNGHVSMVCESAGCLTVIQ